MRMKLKSYIIKNDEKRPDATIALTPAVSSTVRSIPRDFIFLEDITHFPPAFDSALLDVVAFKKDFENLFDHSHLQMLHADYGTGSSRRKGRFPCLDAMKAALPQQQKTEDISEPYAMKLASNRYINNFKVIWSKSKRYFRLVNNVLIALLPVHLAPERERSKREYVERKKSEKNDQIAHDNPLQTKSRIADRSYNARRRLFKQEMRNQERYESKADSMKHNPWVQQEWVNRGLACEVRLDTYSRVLNEERAGTIEEGTSSIVEQIEDSETERDVLADENPQVAEEILDNEDATPDVSNDVTIRRLFVLRAIVRKVVFHCTKEGVTFSEDQLKESLNDITDQELVVCSTICRFLLPYITTVHISNAAHQLPLFLMSDDLFRIYRLQ